MTTPRCPVCGHERLLGPFEINNADLNFFAREVSVGVFGKPLLVQPTHARVCAGCGHFAVFVDGETLRKLRGG